MNDLSKIVAGLSPYGQIKVLRLIADEVSYDDDAYMAINNAANQIEHELLAETALANGYSREMAA